jgi:hypothetical protein
MTTRRTTTLRYGLRSVARSRDLRARAQSFAGTLQDLLTSTVCDYAQVDSVVCAGDTFFVGSRLDGTKSRPVMLRTRARTRIWLRLGCHISLDDDERQFITVQSSLCSLYLGNEAEHLLLHYDYERGKETYAEAHLQISARHEAFERYIDELGEKRGLAKIHLPVGGRRFRPAVEDVLEALIVERLVDPKDGWRSALDEKRKAFRKTQISAVVRRNHGTAIKELERLGYTVLPPEEELLRMRNVRLIAPKPRDCGDGVGPEAKVRVRTKS